MTLKFACKDHNIATYCEDRFGKQFAAEYQAMTKATRQRPKPTDLEHLRRNWNNRLQAEAKLQEWYDYELIGEPTDPEKTGTTAVQKRQVIRDEHGATVLLIPTVEIS